MTTALWIQLFSPVIAVLMGVLASLLGLLLTGVTNRLKTYLDSHGHAMASRIVTEANERMQDAMQNAAGQIALKIQSGEIRITDMRSICDEVAIQVENIQRKLPDAIRTLSPAPGSIHGGILGKIVQNLPAPAPAPSPDIVIKGGDSHVRDFSTATTFLARAAIVKSRLVADLGLKEFQAAAIVGNLGEESGLEAINEIHPIAGRGGFGWAQWTGSRRKTFEDWCIGKGLVVTDPEANYQFLLFELQGDEKAALEALRSTTSLEEATQCFEARYERAGEIRMSRRMGLAQQAMAV